MLMSQSPPPAPKPARVLITAAGFRRLEAELDQLWRVRRPELTRAVGEAAAMGDRSENAEYIYGKKALRELDRRLRFLRKRLQTIEVVRDLPHDRSRVYFGADVEVESAGGDEVLSLRIVGPDEIDTDRHWISVDSPMARALLGKREGDEVWVQRPLGRTLFTIVAIAYAPP